MDKHRRRSIAGLAVASLLMGGALSACTQDEGVGLGDEVARTADAAVPGTEEEFVDWFGLAAEAVQHCNTASESADGLLDGHSSQHGGADENLDAVLAAGQALENCWSALDGSISRISAEQLADVWTEGTTQLGSWLDSMGETNRAAVVVAAGNADSRPLVSQLFELEHRTDDLADALDALVIEQAEKVGIEQPESLHLYRWNAPEH